MKSLFDIETAVSSISSAVLVPIFRLLLPIHLSDAIMFTRVACYEMVKDKLIAPCIVKSLPSRRRPETRNISVLHQTSICNNDYARL